MRLVIANAVTSRQADISFSEIARFKMESFTSNPGGLRMPEILTGRETPKPGNDRTDRNIRADEFSNGWKEVEGGVSIEDHRPSKGGAPPEDFYWVGESLRWIPSLEAAWKIS